MFKIELDPKICYIVFYRRQPTALKKIGLLNTNSTLMQNLAFIFSKKYFKDSI